MAWGGWALAFGIRAEPGQRYLRYGYEPWQPHQGFGQSAG